MPFAPCLARTVGALCLAGIALAAAPLAAQTSTDTARTGVTFDDRGVSVIAPDGFTRLSVRLRVQTLLAGSTADEEDLEIERTFFGIRRARLRLEGVVWDPRLRLYVQLSFSRADMDWDNSGVPNVLRDASVTMQWTPRFSTMAGQTKLPGNRQRVNSSAELQFPDRSIVNSTFTVDRDVGIWATQEIPAGRSRILLKGAITGGEGRNAPAGNSGLAYTARADLLPFGTFRNGGDYFEGDLAREPEGRLALGIGASYNDRAVRTGGQLGQPLFEPTDISTTFADAIFKRRGFAWSAEYMRRRSPQPITTSGTDVRYVTVGDGVTTQASYLFRNDFETAARFSLVNPDDEIHDVPGVERLREWSVGVTQYLKGHRVKVQGELIHDEATRTATDDMRRYWTLRTSLEVGI